jgi:acyl carrier protein
MSTLDSVKQVLGDTLQLGSRAQLLTAQTPLLGSVPELDSMAVVAVLTAMEETFGIHISDDEVNADVFATVGALTSFVEKKLLG